VRIKVEVGELRLAAADDVLSYEFLRGQLDLPGQNGPIFKESKDKLRIRLYALMIVLDLACITIAFSIGSLARMGALLNAGNRDILVLLLPLFLAVAIDARAYSIHALSEPQFGMRKACKALAIAFAIVMGFLFYMKVSENYSRLALGIGMVGSFALLIVARQLFGRLIGAQFGWSFVNQVLLVDGVGIKPKRAEVVIDAKVYRLKPTMDDPVMLDRAGRLLQNCDRVILACPPERRLQWAQMLKGLDADAEVIAPELTEVGALGIRSSHGQPTLLVSCGPLGIRGRILKRAFDLAIAVPAIVVLAPLMVLIALAIKMESSGPVLFGQPRVGLGNRIFRVLKFRSMRSDRADHLGVRSASRNDDRITRVGRFIRLTSLDELPQLFNVVKGDMSIVGPRPHALASTAGNRLFWAVDRRYLERHVVKPGITGLAQVRGFRGATVTESDLVNRLQADLDYLVGWSIWRDLRILLNTFLVLIHRNAY